MGYLQNQTRQMYCLKYLYNIYDYAIDRIIANNCLSANQIQPTIHSFCDLTSKMEILL